LSIEDVDVDPELMSVYPNPTKGLVTIKLPQNDTIKALTVSDVNGRIIVRGEEDNSVNFEKFNNGVYFLKFITGYGKTVFEKIVKI
jgi:hypothetical protein